MSLFGMEWWEILLWLIPIIGIPGLVGLVLVAPGTMALIGKAIARIFEWLLSTRIGCAILAAIVAAFIADYWRHSTDDAEFAQRTALFEHAQTERDIRIKAETRDEVWQEIANATAENTVIDNATEKFTNEPPPPPAPASDPYRIDPVSRAELCNIAGETGCRPQRAQGVQAPRRAGRHPTHRRLPQAVSPVIGRPAQGKPAPRGP